MTRNSEELFEKVKWLFKENSQLIFHILLLCRHCHRCETVIIFYFYCWQHVKMSIVVFISLVVVCARLAIANGNTTVINCIMERQKVKGGLSLQANGCPEACRAVLCR